MESCSLPKCTAPFFKAYSRVKLCEKHYIRRKKGMGGRSINPYPKCKDCNKKHNPDLIHIVKPKRRWDKFIQTPLGKYRR